MESPNVPKALAIARKLGWQFDIHVDLIFRVPALAVADVCDPAPAT